MCNRNHEHRMIAGERGNTWALEEKGGGRRLEARQKVYLKDERSKEVGTQ